MNHTLLAPVAACGAAFASSSADATPIVVSASVPGIAIVIGQPPPPPVYVAPAPVYVEPAPVYVDPYPYTYYAPPPRPVVYHRPRAAPVRTVVVDRGPSCGPGQHHGHHKNKHRGHRR
jgi:hypothetical protein